MPLFSFPKQNRLLKGRDFKAVKGTKLSVSSPYLLFLAKPNMLKQPRLGLAIAKKHLKLAVARNRVKRIIRESFRQHRQQLPDLDIIVFARSNINQLNRKELHQCIEKSWLQLAQRAKCS